jgi:hypothetical protein
MWHGCPSPPRSASAARTGWRGPSIYPHLLAHEFQMTGFAWEYLVLRQDLGYRGAQTAPGSLNPPRYEAPRRARASRQPRVPATPPGHAAAPLAGTWHVLPEGAWSFSPSATLIRAGTSLRWSAGGRGGHLRTWHVAAETRNPWPGPGNAAAGKQTASRGSLGHQTTRLQRPPRPVWPATGDCHVTCPARPPAAGLYTINLMFGPVSSGHLTPSFRSPTPSSAACPGGTPPPNRARRVPGRERCL